MQFSASTAVFAAPAAHAPALAVISDATNNPCVILFFIFTLFISFNKNGAVKGPGQRRQLSFTAIAQDLAGKPPFNLPHPAAIGDLLQL